MSAYFLTIYRHHDDPRGPFRDREPHPTLESALAVVVTVFRQKNAYVPLPFRAGVAVDGRIHEMSLNPPARGTDPAWWDAHVECLDGAHSVLIESRARCIGALHEEIMEGNRPAIPDALK